MSKTVEELDFKVIIDDKEFNAKIEEVKKQAKELNTSLSGCLDLTKMSKGSNDKILEDLKQMTSKQRALEKSVYNTAAAMQKFQLGLRKVATEAERNATQQERTRKAVQDTAAATAKAELAQKKLAQASKEQETALTNSSKLWREIGTVAAGYFSIQGAQRLVSNLVSITAEFEKQRISLEAILRDVNGADALFEKVKGLALISPFNFKELVTYTKQLSAYSVPMGELYDTTKMLADVSAGLGTGMDRLILAYGQIRSASFLRGQEVRQLTESGVPVLQELSNMLTEIEGKYVSVGEVFDKISQRQVTFEMIAEIFKRMTSEGGKFYNMQEVLASTLAGKISNLKDAYQIMFAEIGNQANGLLSGSVDALRKLAENYENVGKAIVSLVAAFGAYKLAIVAIPALKLTTELYAVAKGASVTVPALRAATEALKLYKIEQTAIAALSKINPWAAVAAGIAAVTIALVTYKKELSLYEKTMNKVNDTVGKFDGECAASEQKLRYLIKSLNNATKGSAEYERAKKSILSTYGEYLSKQDVENINLGKTIGLYERLSVAIREAARERALSAGSTDIENSYIAGLKDIDDRLKRALESVGIDSRSELARQLSDYIRGDVSVLTDEMKNAYEMLTQRANFWKGANNMYVPDNSPLKTETIEELRQAVTDLANDMSKARANLESDIDRLFGTAKKKGEQVFEGWKKDVREILKAASDEGLSLGAMNVDESTSLTTFIEDLKKAIKEANDAYEVNIGLDEKAAAVEKRRLEYYNKINAALKNKANDSKEDTKKENSAVKAIEDQINAYKKLKKAYEDYSVLVDENSARKMLKLQYGDVFGDMVNAGDFDTKINELLGKLSKLDAEAAVRLGGGISDTILEAWKKSAIARKKFDEEVDNWLAKSFDLEGKGIALDISNILKKKQVKDAGIDAFVKNLQDSLTKAETSIKTEALLDNKNVDAAWNEYKRKGEEAIKDLAKQERENNKKNTQEAIDDLAQKYAKESIIMNFGSEDALNAAGQSLKQIRENLEKLQTVKDTFRGLIPNEVLDKIKEADLSIEELYKKIEQILNSNISSQKDKELSKIEKAAKITLSTFEELGNSISKLGDDLDSEVVKSMGEMVGNGTKFLKTMVDAAKTGDKVALITTAINYGISSILDVISRTVQYNERLAAAAKDYQNTLNEIARDQSKTLFGTDQISLIKTNMDIVSQKTKDLNDAISKLFNGKWKFDISQGLITGDEDLKKKLNGIIGGDLFIDGKLNATKLREYMSVIENEFGPNITKKIQAIVDAEEELVAANELLGESFSDMFSNIASDIVTNILTAYDELGTATANLSSVFEDLGRSIAQSLLQSFIIDNVLKKYEGALGMLMTQYSYDKDIEKLSYFLGAFAARVQEEMGDATDFMTELLKSFEAVGLYSREASNSANTLSNSIKGITENTADLLASYVNAIRADVAGIRSTSTTISNDVKILLGLVPQQQTLEDYLMKITANQSNMINWMTSITTGGHPAGGEGIKVITD